MRLCITENILHSRFIQSVGYLPAKTPTDINSAIEVSECEVQLFTARICVSADYGPILAAWQFGSIPFGTGTPAGGVGGTPQGTFW